MKSRVFALAAAGVLSACAAREPRTEVTPPPDPRPVTPPVRQGPSSDAVWLCEMLTQRLELSAALAWAEFERDAPSEEEVQAQIRLLTEAAVRVGLPSAEAGTFFGLQAEAALRQREVLFEKWRNPRRRPALHPPSAAALREQIDAVDLQILASIVRMRGFPKDRGLQSFARQRMISRNVPAPIARIAASALAQ